MAIYKRENGVYYFSFCDSDGKRFRVSTGTKIRAEALKFLRAYVPDNKAVLPLSVITREYLIHIETNCTDKTLQTYKTTLKFFTSFIGASRNVFDITTYEITQFLQVRAKATAYGARKDRINLSAMFNYISDNHAKHDNPVTKSHKIRLPEKMPHIFTDEELNRLLAVCNEDMRDLINFAVNTGLRQMEIFTLKMRDFDKRGLQIILDNREHVTKSKKVRRVPLNKTALDIITRRKPLADGTIFYNNLKPFEQRSFVPYFSKKIITAGIIGLSFHSLRHTFASRLVRAGVSIFVVKELLGHSDIKTTMIYAHLSDTNLRDGVDKL